MTVTNPGGATGRTASFSSTCNFCARLPFRTRIRDIDGDDRLIAAACCSIRLTSTSGSICVTGAQDPGTPEFFRVKSLLNPPLPLLGLRVRAVILR